MNGCHGQTVNDSAACKPARSLRSSGPPSAPALRERLARPATELLLRRDLMLGILHRSLRKAYFPAVIGLFRKPTQGVPSIRSRRCIGGGLRFLGRLRMPAHPQGCSRCTTAERLCHDRHQPESPAPDETGSSSRWWRHGSLREDTTLLMSAAPVPWASSGAAAAGAGDTTPAKDTVSMVLPATNWTPLYVAESMSTLPGSRMFELDLFRVELARLWPPYWGRRRGATRHQSPSWW